VNGTIGVVSSDTMPTVIEDGSNHYMLISGVNMVDAYNTDAEKTMVGAENLIIEMKLKLPSETSSPYAKFRYRAGSKNLDFLEIVTATDGTVGVWTRDNEKVLLTQLSATEWVDLKIAFDFIAGKCVVTSGDNTIVYTKAFTTVPSLNWFRFYNINEDSQFCVDDLKVYSDSEWSYTEPSQEVITEYYQHDFENNSLNGTVGLLSSDPMPVVSGDTTNHYMFIASEVANQIDLKHADEDKTLVGVENLIIEMRLKMSEGIGTADTIFRYRIPNGTSSKNRDFLVLRPNSGTYTVRTYDKQVVGQLSADEWTYIKVAFDFNAKKCVVTCGDNTIVCTSEDFTSPTLNWIRIYSSQGNQLCVDDLKIYSSSTFSLAE